MRLGKKGLMAVSFCLGAVMFATTAFADINSKSGYDQLKSAIKETSKACSERLESYTIEITNTIRDNNKLLVSQNSTITIDNKNKMKEEKTTNEDSNGKKTSTYSFADSSSSIYYSSKSDTYYMSDVINRENGKFIDNPLEKDMAKDIEMIIDALVGNLRDFVAVKEKNDGSKEISGTLKEGQIPALINAVSSLASKNILPISRTDTDETTLHNKLTDIFVTNITGKATVNQDGIIDSILASGTMSCKDENGNVHEFAAEVLLKIYDINAARVVKPDLTGKKVQDRTSYDLGNQSISQKYTGEYKNDIVITKAGSFLKIGERRVKITHIDDKTIAGKYYEIYKDEYMEYAGKNREITFDAQIKDYNHAEIQYVDASGSKQLGSINFDLVTGRLYLGIQSLGEDSNIQYDSTFSRVFDN